MKIRYIFQCLLMMLQVFAGGFSAWVAFRLVFGFDSIIHPGYQFLALAIPMIFVLGITRSGSYSFISGEPHSSCLKKLSYSWFRLFFLLTSALYLASTQEYIKNEWVVSWALLGWLSIMLSSKVGHAIANLKPFRSQSEIRIAIVGAGTEALDLIDQIAESKELSYKIIGIYDDRARQRVDKDASHKVISITTNGTTDDLIEYGRREDIDKIIVALPSTADNRVRALIQKLHIIPSEISIYLHSLKDNHAVVTVVSVGEAPTLRLVRMPLGVVDAVLKRSVDLLLTLLALPAILPICMLIAVVIKLDSSGPIIFKQTRGGYRSQSFAIYKFRTMYYKPDAMFEQARPGDQRVTRVGRWLRRFSLDELPQLFNILKGDLSLVGPRPHATEMDEAYAEIIDKYLSRTRIKPGLTGWAQVNGFRGVTDTPFKMQQRLEHDLYYIDNWSLWLDFKILLATAKIVLAGDNAH